MFVLVRADGVADFAAKRIGKALFLFFLTPLMLNGMEVDGEAVAGI